MHYFLALKAPTKEKSKESLGGSKDDGPADKKSGGTGGRSGIQQQPQKEPTYTTVKDPGQGNQVSFFQENSAPELTAVEGTAAGWAQNLKDEWIHNVNAPKYVSVFCNDEKINQANQFYEEKTDLGSNLLVFKMTAKGPPNENMKVSINPEIGQIQVFITEARTEHSGAYKMVAMNDAGDYDVATWNLNVACKLRCNKDLAHLNIACVLICDLE